KITPPGRNRHPKQPLSGFSSNYKPGSFKFLKFLFPYYLIGPGVWPEKTAAKEVQGGGLFLK
ncbi:MAG: hypothetical protein KFF46_00545, partial [Desulfobacterales bacterium]|nr:hypothetical protein [Desulfobacterales bacterium]